MRQASSTGLHGHCDSTSLSHPHGLLVAFFGIDSCWTDFGTQYTIETWIPHVKRTICELLQEGNLSVMRKLRPSRNYCKSVTLAYKPASTGTLKIKLNQAVPAKANRMGSAILVESAQSRQELIESCWNLRYAFAAIGGSLSASVAVR